ncbi:unnamed protein product [Bursaphelenchus okinawaensis]|uniref:Uncharacterized protein n=1 Tax=Bursaphelenchus okinawaensis TaxID=465554 RepID=A0A811JRY8_9BILA|nr:unnamed protein product [Bursaphelenchus okinawaensis]CAG9080484.1 unnamed protein product [Bursaphelenchus okinawaensis]
MAGSLNKVLQETFSVDGNSNFNVNDVCDGIAKEIDTEVLFYDQLQQLAIDKEAESLSENSEEAEEKENKKTDEQQVSRPKSLRRRVLEISQRCAAAKTNVEDSKMTESAGKSAKNNGVEGEQRRNDKDIDPMKPELKEEVVTERTIMRLNQIFEDFVHDVIRMELQMVFENSYNETAKRFRREFVNPKTGALYNTRNAFDFVFKKVQASFDSLSKAPEPTFSQEILTMLKKMSVLSASSIGMLFKSGIEKFKPKHLELFLNSRDELAGLYFLMHVYFTLFKNASYPVIDPDQFEVKESHELEKVASEDEFMVELNEAFNQRFLKASTIDVARKFRQLLAEFHNCKYLYLVLQEFNRQLSLCQDDNNFGADIKVALVHMYEQPVVVIGRLFKKKMCLERTSFFDHLDEMILDDYKVGAGLLFTITSLMDKTK